MSEPIQRPPTPEFVGIPGGTQHKRDGDGTEDRDWKLPNGTTVYRVTRPLPNPQEQAIIAAKKGKPIPKFESR